VLVFTLLEHNYSMLTRILIINPQNHAHNVNEVDKTYIDTTSVLYSEK